MTISATRLIPHIIILLNMGRGSVVRADLARWAEIWRLPEPADDRDFVLLFITFMTFTPEFRNVFYMRAGMKAKLFGWMCPPLGTLQIHSTNIGPGLFIQHGISTLISAERIGKNCWINQQVSIGFSNETDSPTIGDNVKVAAGAKIIGKVTVGDNVVVGLNSVVIGNVAANSTVLGIPAQVIWKARPSAQAERQTARSLPAGAALRSEHSA